MKLGYDGGSLIVAAIMISAKDMSDSPIELTAETLNW